MAEARGVSPVTIRCRAPSSDQWLRWYGARRSSVAEVQGADVATCRLPCGHRGGSRLAVRHLAAAVRVCWRYAGAQGWCRPASAEGLQGPRGDAPAGRPAGPSWLEGHALLASLDPHPPGDMRDRAILLRLARDGFRARAVAPLRLDPREWDRDLRWGPRPQARQTAPSPVMPVVGTAILRARQTVRPASRPRALVRPRTPPFRPLSGSALPGLTRQRLQAPGVPTAPRGPPA